MKQSGGDIGLPKQRQSQQSGRHRDQPDKTNLAIRHFRHPPESLTPHLWSSERQCSLNDKHQGNCNEQIVSHAEDTYEKSGRLFLRLAIFKVLEKFRVRFEHHHVTLALETLAVSLEATIKRVELGILFVGTRIDR